MWCDSPAASIKFLEMVGDIPTSSGWLFNRTVGDIDLNQWLLGVKQALTTELIALPIYVIECGCKDEAIISRLSRYSSLAIYQVSSIFKILNASSLTHSTSHIFFSSSSKAAILFKDIFTWRYETWLALRSWIPYIFFRWCPVADYQLFPHAEQTGYRMCLRKSWCLLSAWLLPSLSICIRIVDSSKVNRISSSSF